MSNDKKYAVIPGDKRTPLIGDIQRMYGILSGITTDSNKADFYARQSRVNYYHFPIKKITAIHKELGIKCRLLFAAAATPLS